MYTHLQNIRNTININVLNIATPFKVRAPKDWASLEYEERICDITIPSYNELGYNYNVSWYNRTTEYDQYLERFSDGNAASKARYRSGPVIATTERGPESQYIVRDSFIHKPDTQYPEYYPTLISFHSVRCVENNQTTYPYEITGFNTSIIFQMCI